MTQTVLAPGCPLEQTWESIPSAPADELQVAYFADHEMQIRKGDAGRFNLYYLGFNEGPYKSMEVAQEAALPFARTVLNIMLKKLSTTRKLGTPALIPNSNNRSSGIAGIRAFFLDRGGKITLHFVATWVYVFGRQRVNGSQQFSSEIYGVIPALANALEARSEGAGVKVPDAETAWELICQHWKATGQDVDALRAYRGRLEKERQL